MKSKHTWSDWSSNDEARYSMLYSFLKKQLKDLDEFTFIDDNKRVIMTLIEKNDKWADKTKEALLFMCGKYLKASNDLRYGKMYSSKGHEYMEKNREVESHNEQDPKEAENYRDHKYFINILESIDYNNIKGSGKSSIIKLIY